MRLAPQTDERCSRGASCASLGRQSTVHSWASDFMFSERGVLDEFMETAIRHAFIGGHPERLLRYFGRAVRKDGQPRCNFGGSFKTKITSFDGGCRIRH